MIDEPLSTKELIELRKRVTRELKAIRDYEKYMRLWRKTHDDWEEAPIAPSRTIDVITVARLLKTMDDRY